MKKIIIAAASLLLSFGCAVQAENKVEAQPASKIRVKPGIEVLQERNFAGLEGKKVGLLTNPSGVDHNLRSTIDILFNAENVDLVCMFAPEHGVRGDIYAGGHADDTIDKSTGLKVYSVYGNTRKPTPEMLKGLDVVVYDIQDVGSRSYTFISSLGLMMRACAEQGIEVMVLDRPNPVNGLKVEGCLVEDGFHSFVSEFKIPYVYGLTVGELAILINEEGLNCGEQGKDAPLKCKLSVIPMEGWTRDMTFVDTGLPWVLPSPNIPYPQSAIGYPSSGLVGEFNNYLNIGVGYTIPFGTFAAEWLDAEALKAKLDSYEIPGTSFRTIYFKPFSGSSAGKLIQGVEYFYSDYDKAQLTMTQFYVMQAVHELYPKINPFEGLSNNMFDKVCGTDYVRLNMQRNFKVADIEAYWNKDVDSFKELSRKYHLYD